MAGTAMVGIGKAIAGVFVCALAQAAPPPSLILHDLQGRSQDLAQHRGHIMVVNFWATWCAPCRREIPILAALQTRYASQGVMVLGAAADAASTQNKLIRFQHKMKMNYPVWAGATTADMEGMGLSGELPATVILNREGEVVARIAGIVDRADLENKLAGIVGTRPPAVAVEIPSSKLAIRGAATVPS